MNAGATTERVYAALKHRLLSGEAAPGEKLEPARIAEDLASSVTPVRDALYRLVGERLVETRASEGFYWPHTSEPALRDRYAMCAALLRAATRLWVPQRRNVAADHLSADIDTATRQFFDLFAARSDNEEAGADIHAINDRLSAARLAEATVIDDRAQEIRDLAIAFDHEPVTTLLRRIDAYHRQRLSAVPSIVRALYRRQ